MHYDSVFCFSSSQLGKSTKKLLLILAVSMRFSHLANASDCQKASHWRSFLMDNSWQFLCSKVQTQRILFARSCCAAVAWGYLVQPEGTFWGTWQMLCARIEIPSEWLVENWVVYTFNVHVYLLTFFPGCAIGRDNHMSVAPHQTSCL